jgi:glycosyltransferase involved in cell wall biosynthesis
MRNSRPRVSVVVNTYNHELFIAQALSSVLAQDFPATEIETIVVDDGSTDSTGQIATRFAPRIRYLRKPNGGQVSAFDAGISEAQGEIVAFLDGDDWWTKNKISRVVEVFERFPDIAAVGHGFYEVDEQGALFRTTTPEGEYRLSFETAASARFAANLRVFGGTSRLAIRRVVLDRTLPVPLELPFFDNFIFTQAIACRGAVLIPEALCYYRLHSGNLYASESPDPDRLRRKYTLQKGLAENLPKRLASLGVPEGVIAAALECDRVDADRLALLLEGGKPWRTFQIELADFRVAYRKPTIGYALFKYCTLLLTLIMPPKSFYKIRDWYTRHDLQRIRRWIGSAQLTVSGGVRKSKKSVGTLNG